MEILNQFGINPLLLAAQVVNFLLLLFILRKFLYKPILEVLEKRKELVIKTLKNAEESERRLKEVTEREAEAILRSAKEGQKIINEASDEYKRIIEEATKEYERIINKAALDSKGLMRQQEVFLMNQVKDNISDIVQLGLEKVWGRKITSEQRKVIDEVVKES